MQDSHGAVGRMDSLGLIANPFELADDGSADSVGIRLTIRSATLRLLTAMERSLTDPDHPPIVVEKTDQVPGYFPVAALGGVMTDLVTESMVGGVIPAYIPLDMMRIGRVRAALNVIAERVANTSPDALIAQWALKSLVEPDVELAEWLELTVHGFDEPALRASLESDPIAFVARVFGAPVESREGADDLEALMRVSTTRRDMLAANPDDDGSADCVEDSADDPLAEVFVTPLGEMDETALEESDKQAIADALFGDYVIAYVREHVSSVVARGVGAYRAQGCASMAEELKVSKAPTKTLQALFRFAQVSMRSGALIYDRLEMWDSVPDDLRDSIVSTLSRLSAELRGLAVLVLIVVPGKAPELEEAFSTATHILWDFAELDAMRPEDVVFDEAVAGMWLTSASLSGETPEWVPSLMEAIPAGTLLSAAYEALSHALVMASEEGLTQPDPQVVGRHLAGS
jgi:hypothetical protein